MNRKEFTKSFAEQYGISVSTSKEVCKVFDYLGYLLKKNEEEKIYIYNLGTFKHETRKQKKVKHPITGEDIIIPERDEVVFNLSANSIHNLEDEDNEEKL